MKILKEFWGKYEYKIILVIGFLLIAIISFEYGCIQGGFIKANPIIIERPPESPKISPEDQISGIIDSSNVKMQTTRTEADYRQINCAYVGSKNSNKYYPPTCAYAKRIKPENTICFKTNDEAIAQGRIRSAGCK